MGHDLGHTPFGHGGEAVLQEIHDPGFFHHKQSLRIVDVIENDGKGLNLTHEVRDGILKHSKGYGKILPDDPEEMACTIEGRIVRIADIMAYLNHDLDDAIRSGVIREHQVPSVCNRIIGRTHQERATTMIRDLVFSSRASDGELKLAMSDEVFDAMTTLRAFLYENVYRSVQVHREFVKAKKILSELYAYLMENEGILEVELTRMGSAGCLNNGEPREQVVCDFVASITDRHALNLYKKLFFPSPTV
ncbi:MAG: deoxyguanosinetriphosphate triphosphohydrolase [Proteobacteria bacterium]|nr:MAG: deoxyguanosinetriphosphate triphosphohydrolase [Pseudomonadota bacterium]